MKLFCVLFLLPFTSATNPTIKTTGGEVRGSYQEVEGVQVQQFLGVPFGEDTGGKNRYALPQPVKPWSGVRDALHLGASCPQGAEDIHVNWLLADRNESENCLTVNIWVPEGSEDRPILVYFYGGGFQVGANNVPIYNGGPIASIGKVPVVVFNYRLGIFGMLDLGIEGADGNQIIADQILALRWIKENAKAIGGNPDNIVAFGESAGATAIGILLLHSEGQKYINKAIMQSGSPLSKAYLETKERSLRKTEAVAKSVKCLPAEASIELTDKKALLDCLREVTPYRLVQAQNEIGAMVYMPTFPSTLLPNDPRENKPAMKPLLIGYTPQEGAFIAYFLDTKFTDFQTIPEVSDAEYNFRFKAYFKGFTDKDDIAEIYRTQGRNNFERIVNALSDGWVKCPVAKFTRKSDTARTYLYKFELAGNRSRFGPAIQTTHLDDIPIVFGTSFLRKDFPQDERDYARKIIGIWVKFAEDGNPGSVDGVTWPPFDKGEEKMILRPENAALEKLDDSICVNWV